MSLNPLLILMAWIILVLLILFAWVAGQIHMSLVPTSEHALLDKNRLHWRVWTYSAPLAGTWAVVIFVRNVLEPWVFSLGLLFAAIAVILFLFVLIFSYMETFWYHKAPQDSVRRKLFYGIALPILYSSLWLYWVAIVPIWLLLALG